MRGLFYAIGMHLKYSQFKSMYKLKSIPSAWLLYIGKKLEINFRIWNKQILYFYTNQPGQRVIEGHCLSGREIMAYIQ